MNYPALRFALAVVARTACIWAAVAIALLTAIGLPTFALYHFANWQMEWAYLVGCPVGCLTLALIAIGVSSYRERATQP